MAGMMDIGLSGLMAFQQALNTTSNNIVNANTPGYSRQRVMLTPETPTPYGDTYVGNGVALQAITRSYDSFLFEQVVQSRSLYHRQETLYSLSSQIDSLLASEDAGVTPVLDRFFASTQDVANDPTSIASRQTMIGEAESLVSRFQTLYAQFARQRDSTNAQIGEMVEEVNLYTARIADLNTSIAKANAGTGSAPNELLDQRDQMIDSLASLLDVNTSTQTDGSINISVVAVSIQKKGGNSLQLEARSNPYDRNRTEVGYVGSDPQINISSQLTGGALGGVLEFRRDVLEPAMNALGRTAIGITEAVNAQHRLGMDLNGELGGDFFTPLSGRALGHASNTGDASITVGFDDIQGLTESDYRLERTSSGYLLTRLSDDTQTDLSALGFPASSVTVDGLELSLDSGSMAVGDTFLLQPTRIAAGLMGVEITDPTTIAAAVPLSATAGASNSGSGAVSGISVSDIAQRPLSAGNGPITLTYRDDTGGGSPGFVVTDSSGVIDILDYDPTTDRNGKGFTLAAPFDGITLQMSGAPTDGDTFLLADTAAGSGDNGNILQLSDLETLATMGSGSETFHDSYAALVSEVATTTSQAALNESAQKVLLQQAEDARAAKSGVNLDEEAANLLRYQQAYQAAAQVISTANEMFQTLIGAVGR